MVLETARITLREFTLEDVDAMEAVLCDHENMRFYPAPFDRNMVIGWIERSFERYRQDGTGLWAMVHKGNSQVIGDCGLLIQEVDGVEELEIGYHLRRDMQGQGLATEAAQACKAHAFEKLGRNRVISLIRPENIPSRRVAERNGMIIEKQTIWRDIPHLVYAATRLSLFRP